MAPLPSTAVLLRRRPEGEPRPGDFEVVRRPCPEPEQGQLRLEVLWLSLDPYMRGRMSAARSYAAPVELGGVMTGQAVARVESSRHPGFAPGDLVLADAGWCTAALSDGAGLVRLVPAPKPVTAALGVLGMPGLTAYAGLAEIGRPKAGETVAVAAATGPVGSAVGQIAKKRGCRAVGIAGGAEKCRLLVEHFGFDAAVDHRAPDFPARLAAACPDGIDVYFENVGGAVWEAVLPLLNGFARVPVCGLVSHYNATALPEGPNRVPEVMRAVLSRRIEIRGFIVWDFPHRAPEFRREVGGWLADGSMRALEHRVEGLENAPAALVDMLAGRNTGKVVVRVAPDAPD
ncbi:NADP-dependent oxidoreductase [Lichenibacterium dinghuense]|uniref:NADP-dependent oxidoreductase n=1 Tax=Lichenibacterium dinghuense TaxID=2895977 RepID=UPI001F481FF9|nr:NADP-dependent oxidoreductase [Lichenibacterium sp. 6Y81]